LYGHPTVRPGELAGARLDTLRRVAETAERPVVLYPEGTRSRDGRIRPFKRAGLRAILGARIWSVHVVVGDGMFGVADLSGFLNRAGRTTIRVESAGPFRFDHRKDDAESFISKMEGVMTAKLAEMRGSAGVL
jgi:1-acyl-sn-glycerol-3-phosphate acyltransferase